MKDQSQLFLAVVADRIDVAAVIEVVDDVGPTLAEDLLGRHGLGRADEPEPRQVVADALQQLVVGQPRQAHALVGT